MFYNSHTHTDFYALFFYNSAASTYNMEFRGYKLRTRFPKFLRTTRARAEIFFFIIIILLEFLYNIHRDIFSSTNDFKIYEAYDALIEKKYKLKENKIKKNASTHYQDLFLYVKGINQRRLR